MLEGRTLIKLLQMVSYTVSSATCHQNPFDWTRTSPVSGLCLPFFNEFLVSSGPGSYLQRKSSTSDIGPCPIIQLLNLKYRRPERLDGKIWVSSALTHSYSY